VNVSARYVTLGNGQRVSLGAYVAGWRTVNAAPDGEEYSHGLCQCGPATALEVRAEYAEGLHDRINRHIAGFGVGRKWDADWQRYTLQSALRLNTPRLIVRAVELPLWLRDRMAHRVTENDCG
jgi:hypothetical protein